MEVNKGGRPAIDFDREQAKKLMSLWCTKEEMSGWFEMSLATFERKCRDWAEDLGFEGGSFETLRNIYGANTKASIRRAQIATATKGNATMLVWLGKQLLGQKDSIEENDSLDIKLSYSLDDL